MRNATSYNFCLRKEINKPSSPLRYFILLGDFNFTIQNTNLDLFMNAFNLESLIKTPTSFKINNRPCIDLTIGNRKELFKKSYTVEVGISDHPHLVTTILKSKFIKNNLKAKFYKDNKK